MAFLFKIRLPHHRSRLLLFPGLSCHVGEDARGGVSIGADVAVAHAVLDNSHYQAVTVSSLDAQCSVALGADNRSGTVTWGETVISWAILSRTALIAGTAQCPSPRVREALSDGGPAVSLSLSMAHSTQSVRLLPRISIPIGRDSLSGIVVDINQVESRHCIAELLSDGSVAIRAAQGRCRYLGEVKGEFIVSRDATFFLTPLEIPIRVVFPSLDRALE